ncbi:energy transducer TonB [Solimonas terrae]|uniref:Energy transducer TonB n=1 Tax=Solimonas terrae TaxID=1396819 RepID=A0A6M2BSX3_9GAMM|nr:energy transducer TonB [Solimonas terrae]NGY05464.1 energy transducer TonB [Solimonas terrae]
MRNSSAQPDNGHVAGGQVRSAQTRGWAFALTVLLHTGLLATLLTQAQTPARHAVTAQRPLVFVQLPSAIVQAERSTARPKRTRAQATPTKRRRPVVASKPSAAAAPATAIDSGADSQASTPAPVAAPPMDADPGVPPPTAYLMRITRIISFEQKYPWSARQYDQQGDVIVRMHLARDGRVLSVRLIRSSGYASLDDEARDVILRIGRFPPFPFDYLPQVAEFDIDQPVTFRHYLN